jgi:hypothetical protein
MIKNKILYREGYKYQLGEDYFHVVNDKFDSITPFNNGFLKFSPSILLIKAGYAWDGASGIAIDTKSFMRGSLVHDALYQCMRLGLLSLDMKDECDKELVRICKEDGMSHFRASYVYEGVKLFGMKSATKLKEVITAP